MQNPSSPTPCTSNNKNNTNFNAVSTSALQISNEPSQMTVVAPPIPVFSGMSGATNEPGSSSSNRLAHRRAYSDGSFKFVEDDTIGPSGDPLEDAGDDLFSALIDLEKLEQIEDDIAGCLMDQDNGSIGGSESERKRKNTTPCQRLADIWSADPKRAKRIVVNRQSATRSKERIARYISQLEEQVRRLQLDTTNLCAQVAKYKRDAKHLATKNAKLNLQLQSMEQQVQLRDVLNDALNQDVEMFKLSSTSSQKTLNESFSFKVQPYSPLTSPSALKPTVQYSPLASPSSTSSTLPPSPIAFPSPSNLLSPTYNPSAAFSPRNTSLFPVSKKPAPLLADMPPFRNPHVGQSSGHIRLTSPATPLEQRKSTSLADAKSPPFSSVEKNSPTQ
ncbi:hypothetical protein RHGRI_025571 [Rhododendron griersonianum]|uniref:BZIP domain-containing protein n=1 Tax=Rhododendron griersonianum TaxID=479676 RepID=A0AAV6IT61_9ERIC|nr:hypothetical protein RHGRI_025571 [Rhododendron griersonianum]